jgi:hypothetical protein
MSWTSIRTKEAVSLPLLWSLSDPEEDKPKFDHFTYNYQSYVDRYWPQRRQAVAVLRMEQQWRDVARLEGLLGGDPGRFADVAQSTTRVSHGSEGFALQGGVSPEGAIGLCCAAWTELQVYQALIVAAVNLNVREKRDTLLALHVHCGRTAAEQSSWGRTRSLYMGVLVCAGLSTRSVILHFLNRDGCPIGKRPALLADVT